MATSYIVKSGDTLSKIAKANNTTVDAIAKANNISNVNMIRVGQSLNFGGSTPSSTPKVSNYDVQQYRSQLTALTTPSSTIKPTPLNYGGVKPSTISAPNPSAGSKAGITPFLSSTLSKPRTTPAPTQSSTPYGPIKPTPSGGGSYVVNQGDTLSRIASKNGMTLSQLLAMNPDIKNANMIQVGQKINLASGSQGGPVYGPIQPTTTPAPSGKPSGTPTMPSSPAGGGFDSTDVARRAGEAGLSIAEYQSLNSVSQAESDAIAKELGIDVLEGTLFKKPSESTQKTYEKAYETAGLADVKKKIEKLNEQIDKERQDLTEATGAIDDNPFLTESSRVGRGKRILEQAQSSIGNKLAQIKTLEGLYDDGVNEITAMITRNTNDFGRDQKIDEAKLNYLLKKAEIRSGQLKDSKSQQGLGTYLSARAGASQDAPEVFGNADTGYYKYDNATQKFVQVISPANKGVDEFKPTSEQQGLVGRFLSTPEAKALGATADDYQKALQDPQFFWYLLELANQNGIY